MAKSGTVGDGRKFFSKNNFVAVDSAYNRLALLASSSWLYLTALYFGEG